MIIPFDKKRPKQSVKEWIETAGFVGKIPCLNSIKKELMEGKTLQGSFFAGKYWVYTDSSTSFQSTGDVIADRIILANSANS